MTATLADAPPTWAEIRSAALVGTSKRRLEGPGTGDPAATAQERLLDAAAVIGAGRRAGFIPGHAEDVAPPAPAEERPSPPARAVQLLELLLQDAAPPGVPPGPLFAHWCRQCSHNGYRIPHHLLCGMLTRATSDKSLRAELPPVLGTRGVWLATMNDAWAWAGQDAVPATAVDVEAWRLLPRAERVVVLEQIRADHPGGARDLIEADWATDAAADRGAHLGAVAVGLDPADEPLLETALDDRAASVRTIAQNLLDGLAGSARAERMSRRLRPLLHVEGRKSKRRIRAELPDDPDDAAVRDGLGPAPSGRSARGWWLEQLAAAAPLDVWTEASGDAPGATVQMIADADILRGMARATVARRDRAWARAMWPQVDEPALISVMSPGDAGDAVLGRIGQLVAAPRLAQYMAALPGQWSSEMSKELVERIRRSPQPPAILMHCRSPLESGLHADALADLQRWLSGGASRAEEGLLQFLVSSISFRRSITEAFP